MRCPTLTLLALLAAGPAVAQQRVVVVPAGTEVVVPARGAAAPGLVNAPRPRIPPRNATGTSSPGVPPMPGGGTSLGGSDLAVAALIALPIAAIAAAAATIPGSGGGGSNTSAPARTR